MTSEHGTSPTTPDDIGASQGPNQRSTKKNVSEPHSSREPGKLGPTACGEGAEPRVDVESAIRFLLALSPEGPWCLLAIGPDIKGSRTETFYPGDETRLRDWIELINKGSNVYFTVNPVRTPLAKKPRREDIAEIRFLHVDVDPRAGADLAEERARIEQLLLKGSPSGLVPPTFVIFSGGGYQALWRLREPIPISQLADAESAALYNVHIENVLGGDRCHNIDRALRLPGTVNWPNKKKSSRGQVPAIAQLVASRGGAVYDLSKFERAGAESVSFAARRKSGAAAVEISAAVKQLESLDSLPDSVSLRCRRIIEHGFDPEEPDRLSSRSEWVFSIVCELVRAGVDDGTIYSIITDERWPICAHVLEQHPVQDYAERQIRRAKELAGISRLPDGRPRFPLPQGDDQFRVLAVSLGRELAETERHFSHNGRWVLLGSGGRFKQVSPALAVTQFESVAGFGIWRKEKNDIPQLVPKTITRDIATVIVSSEELLAALPEITAVVDCPVLVESQGELRLVKGYDEESGIYARGER